MDTVQRSTSPIGGQNTDSKQNGQASLDKKSIPLWPIIIAVLVIVVLFLRYRIEQTGIRQLPIPAQSSALEVLSINYPDSHKEFDFEFFTLPKGIVANRVTDDPFFVHTPERISMSESDIAARKAALILLQSDSTRFIDRFILGNSKYASLVDGLFFLVGFIVTIRLSRRWAVAPLIGGIILVVIMRYIDPMDVTTHHLWIDNATQDSVAIALQGSDGCVIVPGMSHLLVWIAHGEQNFVLFNPTSAQPARSIRVNPFIDGDLDHVLNISRRNRYKLSTEYYGGR